jgi:hypothetical protein
MVGGMVMIIDGHRMRVVRNGLPHLVDVVPPLAFAAGANPTDPAAGAGGGGGDGGGAPAPETVEEKQKNRAANSTAADQIRLVQRSCHGLMLSKIVFQQKAMLLLPDAVSAAQPSSYAYSSSSAHALVADIDWVTSPALGALQVFVEHAVVQLLERALLVARSPDFSITTRTHSQVLIGSDVATAIQILREDERGGAFKTYAQAKAAKKAQWNQQEVAAPWHCCVFATADKAGRGSGGGSGGSGGGGGVQKAGQKRVRREITVIFNGLSGDQVKLNIDPAETRTIGQLKQLYETDQGVPADSLMLMLLDQSPESGGGSGGSSSPSMSKRMDIDIGGSMFDDSEDELGGLADTLALEDIGIGDGTMLGVMPLDWCIEVLPEGGQPISEIWPPSPPPPPPVAPVGRGGAGGNRRREQPQGPAGGSGNSGSGSGSAVADGSLSAAPSVLVTSTDAVLPAVEAAIGAARSRLAKVQELEKAALAQLEAQQRHQEKGLQVEAETGGGGEMDRPSKSADKMAREGEEDEGEEDEDMEVEGGRREHITDERALSGGPFKTTRKTKGGSPSASALAKEGEGGAKEGKGGAKGPAKKTSKSPPKSSRKSKSVSKTKGKGKEWDEGDEETRRILFGLGGEGAGCGKAGGEGEAGLGSSIGASGPHEAVAYAMRINAPKDGPARESKEAAVVRAVERLSSTPATKRCIDPALFELMLRETATLTAGLHCYWTPEAVVAAHCLAEARLKKLIRRATSIAEHRYPGIVAEQSMRSDLPPMSPRVEGCVYGSDIEEAVSVALGPDMGNYGGHYGLPLPLPDELGWRGPRRPAMAHVRDELADAGNFSPVSDEEDDLRGAGRGHRYPMRNRVQRDPGAA